MRFAEKYPIDYVEISGISNEEVHKIITEADFALDEYYSDTPLSGFATECAFQYKPVVVGSYYAASIHEDYPKNILPPSMFVAPENIEDTIEKLIVDTGFRNQSAKEIYDFVVQNWTATLVARKYLKLIDNTFPKEWLYDPGKITYLFGCGLSGEEVKSGVSLRRYALKT